jgi:hypothetical protein
MKFKSSVYTQVSGSVGGLTYAHNQAGMYSRARSVPTNTATALQQVIRRALTNAQTAWKALSSGTRAQWKAYAAGTPVPNALGDSQKLTGLAMFVRQYVSRAQNVVTQITTAPDTPGLAELSPVTVARHGVATSFDFTFNNADAWAAATGGYLALYQSAPQRATREFWKGPYRLMGKIAGNTGSPPTSPATVDSLYALVAGQHYFFRVIAVDAEGRMSGEVFLDSTVS